MKLCLFATIFSAPKWTDEVGLALSGVLALVGIVGIIVAICTLKIIGAAQPFSFRRQGTC